VSGADGGPINYGFCAFYELSGIWPNHTAFVDTTAKIFVDNNGYWAVEVLDYQSDASTDITNANVVCALFSDFTPAFTTTGASYYSVTTGPNNNPNSVVEPSSGYAICPWSDMQGAATPEQSEASQCNQVFGANPTGGSTTIHVTQDDSNSFCADGNLTSAAWCSYVNAAPKYGTAAPGNSNGWEYTLSGSNPAHTLGNVSDAICYITEWDTMQYELSSSAYNHVWLSQSGGSPNQWVINKNETYISVNVTCIPYNQN
jgi:hypothetical protein